MTTLSEAPTTTPDGAGTDADEPTRRRRRVVVPGLAALLVAAAAVWLVVDDDADSSDPAGIEPVATTKVERGTVAATLSWTGTVDYGESFTVTGNTGGVVTRVADQRTPVERGGELLRIDERPVVLLYGSVPMYRDLGPGSVGVDVAQLEANLTELGYGGFVTDDSYDPATADAVRAWQGTVGAPPTGTVGAADVVFVPDGRRVESVRVAVGQRIMPGTAVLDLTSTTKVVEAQVAPDDRDVVAVDTAVTVVLPDGSEVPGRVTASTLVEAPASDPMGGRAEPETAVGIVVSLDAEVPDDLVGGSVEVVVALEERTDVLLVPVNALLALAEGGYGLEVVEDGTSTVVEVTTGLFAGGKVEVSGDGITEGTVVGVAGR